MKGSVHDHVSLKSHNRKLASLEKSKRKYYTLVALLETWEPTRNTDPEYVNALTKRVYSARNQLRVKMGSEP